MAEFTKDEIMAKISEASKAGDIGEVVKLGNLLKKFQVDIQKAEAERAQKEAEALSGIRLETSQKIFQAIRKIKDLDAILMGCKATGFTFKVDAPDKDGVMVNYTSVSLTVPVIKEKKAGSGGGGGTGITVASQTGMPRKDLLAQYATQEEKDKIAKARADATERGGNANSTGWSAEQPVVKRILAEHPELIKK